MSAVLGFVQGVAEFLPISSSGHLTLLQHFFGMPQTDQLFNILLHFATLLAVCVFSCTSLTLKCKRALEENTVLRGLTLSVVLVVTIAYMVDATSSPFLYFRF